MRILMVSSLFPTPAAPKVLGGAEIVARRLADALVAQGVQVTVVRAAPPGTDVSEEDVGEMRVLSLPICNSYSPFDITDKHGAVSTLLWHARDDWGTSTQMRDIIARERPDVLHTHNIGSLSTGVWRGAHAAGIPIVHTLHDYYLLCPRTTRFKHGKVCVTPCGECRALTLRRRADTKLVGDVIGVSRAVLQPHLDNGLFATAQHHIVPNIIQPELSVEPHPPRTPVTFGFLGRITTEKGVECLAEAFGAMQTEARLVFGGRVDEATKARLTALAGGRTIDFLGFVSPADFFSMIDVLVVSSIWEDPLPTVILEAQTAGVATLGSTRGGIPEAIGGQSAGWTYNPDEPDALRSMLDHIASDLKIIQCRAKSAKDASKRFHVDTVVTQYMEIYKK